MQKVFLTCLSLSLISVAQAHCGVDIVTAGGGPGIATQSTDPPISNLPDFITSEVTLSTPWGLETYRYGNQETLRIDAYIENKGDANWAGDRADMYVKAYFSRGYKVDSHGSWINVGTGQIKRGNINVGEEKHEWFLVNLKDLSLTPGIYNVVVCADRKYDQDNGDGEVPEKHKSNNCSTEAVFEVTMNPYENIPSIDFIISSISLTKTPLPVPTQSTMGAKLSVRNIGNQTPPSGIRSNYEVCGPLPSASCRQIADDGSDAGELTPGRDQWEEIHSLVPTPSQPGAYLLCGTANYQATVEEANFHNNRSCISFDVVPRPAAKLVIVGFKDEEGCCTTNTGDRIKPIVFARNDGPMKPEAIYPPVIYHIASPIATGGQYIHIGNGSFQARDLSPGETDHDKMDGNGYPIPKSSAWKKQWHTIRACIRADGGQPVGNEATEVCAVYQRYSKK